MTTYTAITAGEIDSDSPITTGLMTKMRDNPIAITEGSTGAPKIQKAAMDTDSVGATQIEANAVGNSELASAAVKQGNLSTSTAENSLTVTNALYNVLHFVATGGSYINGWETRVSNTANVERLRVMPGEDSDGSTLVNTITASYQALWSMLVQTNSTASRTGYARHTYTTASPPYVIGETDYPYFAYLSFDSEDNLVATSLACDPPWAYNGPYKGAADVYKKKYKTLSVDEINQVKEIDEKLKTYSFLVKKIEEKARFIDGHRVKSLEKRRELESYIGRENVNLDEVESIKLQIKTLNNALIKSRTELRSFERELNILNVLKNKRKEITHQLDKNSRPMIRVKRVEQKVKDLKKTDPLAYVQAIKELKEELIELTPKRKNKNMAFVPAPFQAPTGGKVILVAPDDKIMNFLIKTHDDNDVNISELLQNNYVKLKEEVSLSETPAGVNIVRMSFKNNN